MKKKELITEEEAQRIINETAPSARKNKKKYRLNKIEGLTSPMNIYKSGSGFILEIE